MSVVTNIDETLQYVQQINAMRTCQRTHWLK